jgi:hypothetical protein
MTNQKPGPVGYFPKGRKLGPNDFGQLAVRMSVDRENHVIRVEFGTMLDWVVVSPENARKFATSMLEMADALERGE